MKINGVELEDIDVFDVEVMKRYEEAIDNVIGEVSGKESEKISEIIGIQCNAIFHFFNKIFGDGADKKIFGSKVNLLTCINAFEEFKEYVEKQKGDAEKIFHKYSPNRAQRRGTSKNK